MPKGLKGFQKGNSHGSTSWKNRRTYVGEDNPNFGKSHTPEARKKISNSQVGRSTASGDSHYRWRGDKRVRDNVPYYARIHNWVNKTLGTPSTCGHCGSNEKKRYEWANISGEYEWDTSDWIRLCVSCHMAQDRKVKV